MGDPDHADVVLGANRLIVDIVTAVLGTSQGGRAVAVLVDPTSIQWDAIDASATGVIVVLSRATDDEVVAAVHRGADAVVEADQITQQLPEAVEVVRAGGVRLTPVQARAVATALRRVDPTGGGPRLSKREAEILQLICAGHSVKQTALRLGIAPKTVENLQGRLFRKLDARHRAHAVARAYELGLVDDKDEDPSAVDAPHDRGGLSP